LLTEDKKEETLGKPRESRSVHSLVATLNTIIIGCLIGPCFNAIVVHVANYIATRHRCGLWFDSACVVGGRDQCG